ncbi:GTP cyclohydrolase I [Candidatus Pacearchaeota archaeon]|nr:GTP cyclohydrolase I [Candidatus Pacearchaeota archaeon]
METKKNNEINERVIEENFREILDKGLNLDLNDPNFKETPSRVARAYKEIFTGLGHTKEDVEKIFKTCFPTDYKGMVFEKNIIVFSMCPHHFLPVRYEVSVGYIPDGCGVGLSKLVRIIELLAKRPVLQETFTQEIVELMKKYMHTKGAICMVRGEHYCMQIRGVKQKDVVTTTSAANGVFLTQSEMELKFYESMRNS